MNLSTGVFKKIFATLTIASFAFSGLFFPNVSEAQACGGPIGFTEIRTPQDLANISLDPYGSYKLCNNIDLSSSSVFNIFFAGTLDGQNYSISNFRTVNHGSYEGLGHIGLFSTIHNGTVRNLKLLNVDLDFDGAYNAFAGGLAGLIQADFNLNPSLIDNVEITGIIKKHAEYGVGMLAGQVNDSILKSIRINGIVESNGPSVGGVAGIVFSSEINGANVDVTIRHEAGSDPLLVDGKVGGLFGEMMGTRIFDANTVVDINHGQRVGGLVGSAIKVNEIRDTSVDATITTPNALYAGGLVGNTSEGIPFSITITDTQVSGNIFGQQVGGLIGLDYKSSIERTAFKNGNIKGHSRAGGLIGVSLVGPVIVDAYSQATIEKINPESPLYAGGLIGNLFGSASNPGQINNSYFAGLIEPEGVLAQAGGILGFTNNPANIVISNTYFDQTLFPYDNGFGEGKTTQQMKTIMSTYTGWDFMNTWLFENGQYPELRSLINENSCPADFDGNGSIGVPDIFSFLSAWFAQSPSADFDENGMITVPDIFAFLSAWFAGC